MAFLNPDVDYVQELMQLRKIYVCVQPQARWNVIAERLKQSESGPAFLVTVISAVEALARSILVHVHASGGAPDTLSAYEKHKYKAPDLLVKEVLAGYGSAEPSAYFAEDTWVLFEHAVNFRNLIVHECTYLGQDKFPSLIQATEEILRELKTIGGIREKILA